MKRRSKSRVYARFSLFHFIGSGQATLLFFLASVLLLAVSFVRPGIFSGLRSAVSDASAPVLFVLGKPFEQASLMFSGVSSLMELRAENEQLRSENERLREWYQAALMLDSENRSLHALLNLKLDSDHRFVSARVVGDSGSAFARSALVLGGEARGVKKGQAVLSGEGVVGRIIETGRYTSRVLLLTDVNSRLPVYMEGSRQKAILAGTNGNNPILKYLPPDTEIQPGTRVLTSGNGGFFMPDLAVGEIRFAKNGGLYVHLFADIDRLSHVRIVDFSTEGAVGDENTPPSGLR